MGKETGITWCDHTFNPWWGCEKISPACHHCYAETWAKRTGRTNLWGPDHDFRFFGDSHWKEPLIWDKQAKESGQRKRVFCASMADVFEHRAILSSHRSRLFELIEATPNLDWLLLTKRPENFHFVPWGLALWPENVWLGATVEGPPYFSRIDQLRESGALTTFLSIEPMLEPIERLPLDGVSWVIVGCESGPKRRPCDLEWIRSVAEQTKSAGRALFVKQLEVNGRVSTNPADWPEWARIQEFPR